MPKPHLDADLLEKLRKKTGKRPQYLREQISRKASKLGVSSRAAQIIWAQNQGIGVAHALNRSAPEIRQEVRSVPGGQATVARVPTHSSRSAQRVARRPAAITAAMIDHLLLDQPLRDRCKVMLLAPRHYDRVVRESTTVLDDRLKTKTGITHMNPLNLVGKVLNPSPLKAVIEVSAKAEVQEGFYSICKGVMLAFRDQTHHSLSDKFTQQDALKFCGLIDILLATIEQATVHLDRV
jgi:hypothetical protein